MTTSRPLKANKHILNLLNEVLHHIEWSPETVGFVKGHDLNGTREYTKEIIGATELQRRSWVIAPLKRAIRLMEGKEEWKPEIHQW